MKKAKKLLCFVIALMTLMSMCALGFTTQAAVTDAAELTAVYPISSDDFTWDNATVYFLLTDRFNNGNTANDHSYNRGLNRDGSVNNSMNKVASFQGGDFKGITQKIEAGYFTDLGVNAIWVSGWFEQIHGYIVGGDSKKSYAHYAYHGYYGLDFSELDKNYGTEAEFKEMIETAHSKGIRIVLDVVMNHPGYNSIYDMAEYGFGSLNNGWENTYYNFDSINQTNYHGMINYNSDATAWSKWWGSDWIRAGLAGYAADGTNDLTNLQVFLPDFKTESTKVLDVPAILKTKWTKEGTYQTKINELNNTFSKYNLGNKTVRNYLVAWYTQWVEEYGIDGFRCDTAKHVEQESWKALSTACTKALNNWRAANPTAPGADWDEEFWMTGENFGQQVDYNQYYQNGFDSMINFSFSGSSTGLNCDGMKKAGDLNSLYADYANRINTNDNFNVLTYISSHDTGLCRNDIYYQGSAFLLLPGGVQLFYGDESNRSLVECSEPDHRPRGAMNWTEIANSSSEAAKVLAHWQKVGSFRNDHVAVGAGSHAKLSATSGVAFARTYNKNNVTDKVVCVVGANANSNVTITVNNTFANGTEVVNAYDGSKAVVQNDKVTFSAGAHGTILVEAAQATEPTTQATEPATTAPATTAPATTEPATTEPATTDATEATTQATEPTTAAPVETILMGDADGNETVNVKDATAIQKYVVALINLTDKCIMAADADGNGNVNVKDATAIQKYVAGMDTGFDIGKVIEITQTNPTEPTEPTTEATEPTTEATEPTLGNTIDLTQLDANVIVLMNTSYATPYTHTWTTGAGGYDEWPGTPMESLGNGMYYTLVNKNADMIIFNDANGQQTADLSIPGNFAIFDGASNSWVGYLSDYVDVTKFPLDPSLLPGATVPTEPTEPTTEATEPTEPTTQPTTEPTTPPADNTIDLTQLDYNIIVLRNTSYASPYTHTWTTGGGPFDKWPGTQMKSLGNGMYYAEVNKYADMIIFNDGNGNQTDNLVIPGNFAIYDGSTNSWTGYLSDYVDVTKFPLDSFEIPGGSTGNNPTNPNPGNTTLSNKFVAIVYCEVSGTDDASRNKEVEFSADGTLTYNFAGDSYVFVRNYDTGVQYCTDGWSNFANPVTLVNEKNLTGTFDKMYVPEGQHTLCLVDNGNDTYTLSYQ